MRPIALLANVATCIAFAANVSSQTAISTNFRGNGGSQVTATAGATSPAAFAGWNNVNGGSGNNITLHNQAGTDLGTRMSFTSASAGYQLDPPASSQDGLLFDGQIIESVANGPAQISVTGVPFSSYDVYVYVGHGPAHAGRDACVDLNGSSLYFQNQNLQTYTNPIVFQQSTSTNVPGASGNYVVFAGESSSSFALTLRAAPSGNPGSSGIAGFQIVDRGSDSDNDGLPDSWELQWFGNLQQTGAGDPDFDQLSNLGEFASGTTPVDSDTDDDLSNDGQEVARGTDPLDSDSDDDGLLDGIETGTNLFVSANDTGTDPLILDTDGDGPRDGAEVRRGSNPCDANSLPDLPNVIVILADDLGYGELGSFGQTQITTPHLDQMAQEGMRFTQFYSGSPVCAPTRSTIQQGLHTGHCTVRNNSQQATLAAGSFTIGRMLQHEGYTTSFVGKWGVGDVGQPGLPNQQGYDHFFGFLDQVHAHWYYPSYLWRNTQQVPYPGNNGAQGPNNSGTRHAQDEMTEEALSWIDANSDRPFFMQLAYLIPHVSLQEPPHGDPAQAALGKTAIDEFYSAVNWAEPNANFSSSHYTSHAQPRRAYAAMISAMDRDIGRIMARLQTLGIDDNTLVLFTSDNGATTCCGVDHQFFHSMGGLRGAKGQVYEGGIRVPAIARWPNQIAPGSVTNHVGAVWDIVSTVADLIDGAVPDDLDGVSFLPTLLGQPASCQEQHEYLYWEYAQGNQRKAVRYGDFKGVRYGNVGAGASLQLFDLANDPNETSNVVAQYPAVAAAIERIMASRHTYNAQWYRSTDEFPVIANVTLSNANPNLQLDSTGIGYVQCPLVRDAATTLSLPLVAQMQNISGRDANVSLLLGDGVNTSQAISFELDALAAVYRIEHQGVVQQAAFGATTSPFGWHEIHCAYDPTTGVAQMHNQGTVVLSVQLGSGPTNISHYGYRVEDARTVIAPLDPALAGRFRGRWSPFGSGCIGTAGVPLLRAVPQSLPMLSSCFEAEVLGGPTPGIALGILGLSDTTWNGSPLPAPLAAIGMPTCSLHVSVDVSVLLTHNQQGRMLWSLPIPNSQSLNGYRFHQQAAVYDSGANAAGFVTSNAGTGVVGGR